MRIVAVLNQKGGVGKTTTAVNLGAALALRGRRVLLIDADPQGNLTDHVGLELGDGQATLYDVLTDDAGIDAATMATDTERLFVVPSEPDLAAAESELAGELGREGRLSRALTKVDEASYDWVLIDCPPSLGLLSINAMAAASELLITLQTEYFALKGLAALDQVIGMVREHVNPQLSLLGILPTLVNPVTLLSKEVIAEVQTHYGDVVFGTRIRSNVSLAEAPSRGTHIFAYRPSSRGAADYLRLADEIEGRRDTRHRSNATRVATADRKRQGSSAKLARADEPMPGDAPSEDDTSSAADASAESDASLASGSSSPAEAETPMAEKPDASALVTAEVASADTAETASTAHADADEAETEVATQTAPDPESPSEAPRDSAPKTEPASAPEQTAEEADSPPADAVESKARDAGDSRPVARFSERVVSGETASSAAPVAKPQPPAPVVSSPTPPPEPHRRPALEPESPSASATSVQITPRVETQIAERPLPPPLQPEARERQPDVKPEGKPGPVEMDADEARDWFRRAIANRTEG